MRRFAGNEKSFKGLTFDCRDIESNIAGAKEAEEFNQGNSLNMTISIFEIFFHCAHSHWRKRLLQYSYSDKLRPVVQMGEEGPVEVRGRCMTHDPNRGSLPRLTAAYVHGAPYWDWIGGPRYARDGSSTSTGRRGSTKLLYGTVLAREGLSVCRLLTRGRLVRFE